MKIEIIKEFTCTLGTECLLFQIDVIQFVTVKFCPLQALWKSNIAF